MVYVNGDLTTCCLDQHLENKLGNLKEQSLKEVWDGETNQRWRRMQVLDDYEASGPYCSRCNWRSAGAMPHDKVLSWLEKRGDEEGAEAYRERWELP